MRLSLFSELLYECGVRRVYKNLILNFLPETRNVNVHFFLLVLRSKNAQRLYKGAFLNLLMLIA
jgi:hypothetical protein